MTDNRVRPLFFVPGDICFVSRTEYNSSHDVASCKYQAEMNSLVIALAVQVSAVQNSHNEYFEMSPYPGE